MPGEVEIVPTPRTNREVSLLEAPERKFTAGVSEVIAPKVFRLERSSWPPSITVMAIGTDCKGTARLVAVTVTASTLLGSCFSSAGGVLVCAWAQPLAKTALMSAGNTWRRNTDDRCGDSANFMGVSSIVRVKLCRSILLSSSDFASVFLI